MTYEPLDPQDAADAPELLVLESLEVCLHTLSIALIVEYPRLADEGARQPDGPTWRAAQRLSSRAQQLTRAIRSYRKVLFAHLRPPPDPLDTYF